MGQLNSGYLLWLNHEDGSEVQHVMIPDERETNQPVTIAYSAAYDHLCVAGRGGYETKTLQP